MSAAEPLERGGAARWRLLRGPRLAPPEDPEAAQRAPGLTLVRTVAMLSIVGYHVTWQPLFGVAFGLTSLQVILCALAARGDVPQPAAAYALRRARRLLVPWLGWSAVYAAFEVSRRIASGGPPLGWLEPWMWASGTSFHLWFLPFGFAASVAVNAALRLARGATPERFALGACAAGILLLATIDPLKAALGPAAPFDLWLDGAATLPFGLAVGRALALRDRAARARLLLAIASAGAVPWVLGVTLLSASGLHGRYAVAVAFVCLGLTGPVAGLAGSERGRRWLGAVAATNLGVYLVHMLVIRAADHLPGIAALPGALHAALVYALCVGVALLLRAARVPYLA